MGKEKGGKTEGLSLGWDSGRALGLSLFLLFALSFFSLAAATLISHLPRWATAIGCNDSGSAFLIVAPNVAPSLLRSRNLGGLGEGLA